MLTSGSSISYKITPDQWESYWSCQNACGLVDVHQDHVLEIVAMLSERYPGLLILWDCPAQNGRVMISVVRPDKRKIAAGVEAEIVAAAESIARKVARLHPVEHGSLGWLFKRRLNPGWQYADNSVR
jgi:hypothetical protein